MSKVMSDGWTQVPFWSLFRRDKRTGFPNEELLSVYRDYGVIRKADRDDNWNRPGDDLSAYQLVQPGDLVLNKMKTWQGSLGVSPHRGLVSPAYFVYSPRSDNDPRFLHYALRSSYYIEQYAQISKGVRVNQWDLQPEKLDAMLVMLPPTHEQAFLAEFLDRETAEIDAMDAELNHLIQTLQERRAAVIEDSLWSGAPRAASMKLDCELVTSGSRGWADFYADEGDRFLRIADLGRGTYRIQDSSPQHVSVPSGAEGTRTRTQVGDLLFSITAYLGSVGLVDKNHQDAYVSQHVALVRLDQRVWAPAFVAYAALSTSGQRYLTETGYGGTKTQLNLDQVRDIPVPVMPRSDQERTVLQLDAQTARIDDMIADANRLKQLLAERRSTLITEVVTGKKKVPA